MHDTIVGTHYQESNEETKKTTIVSPKHKHMSLKDKSFGQSNFADKESFGKELEKAQVSQQLALEANKSEQFEKPTILKQQTIESATFGLGTPTARSIITPNFGQTPTFRTNTSYTSRKSRKNTKIETQKIEEEKDNITPPSGVINDNELESESRSPTPLTLEEAIALKVEQAEKTRNKREMFSGKAQYETPLDLNGMLLLFCFVLLYFVFSLVCFRYFVDVVSRD